MLRTVAVMLLAGCLALAGPSAIAHDVDKGPNGGQMIDVKGQHVELTVKGAEIVVYLSDKGHAPLASKGASGRATLLIDGKQSQVELAAAEPNRLTARAPVALPAGARVVISARLAGGNDIIARFVVK